MAHSVRSVVPVTFSGSANSAKIKVKNLFPRYLRRPSGMSGTTLTAQFSPDDGTTWLTIKDKTNTAVTLTIDSSAGITRFDPNDLFGFDVIRFQSGSPETATLYLGVSEV